MAQPHKGNRHTIFLTLDLEVRRQIHSRATDSKLSVSQFLADHLALHVGRPDLVYALGQGTLMSFRSTDFDPRSPATIVRCLEEVYALLRQAAQQRGIRVTTYVAGFCTRLVNDEAQTEDQYGYQEVLATSA
jgi:hypothetical protein